MKQKFLPKDFYKFDIIKGALVVSVAVVGSQYLNIESLTYLAYTSLLII